MNTDILIITLLTATIIIIGGPQLGYGIALNVMNKTTTNMTDVNGAGGNTTIPDTQTDSLSDNDKTGNIASLPGKCLGSALCPD